jgi:hypothetical protein
MKNCKQCKKDTGSNRKQYCSESCKWRYNSIKKDNEKHLPPVKKRNENFFRMVVGSTWDGKGQGRRSGGLIKGAMSAMVRVTVEEYAEVNSHNIKRHLKGIPGYIPNGIQLCNGVYIDKMHIKTKLGIDI